MKKQIVLWGGAGRLLSTWKFSILLILSIVLNASGLVGQTTPFFSVLNLSDAQLMPDQLSVKTSYQQWPQMKSIHIVQLANPLLAQSGQIALQVPGDTTTYTFTATNVQAYSSGDFVWYGDMTHTSDCPEMDLSDDCLSGLLSLIGKDGKVFGEMRIDTSVFQIPYLGDGLNALVRFEVQDFNNDNFCINDDDDPPPTPNPETEMLLEDRSSCPIVRVLVLYTDLAIQKFPDVKNIAETAHASARQTMLNSAITTSRIDLRLVGIERLPGAGSGPFGFVESGFWSTDEPFILASPVVQQLKSAHQADLVMIFTDAVYGPFTGKVFAFGGLPISPTMPFAWVEVPSASAPGYTYAHEMGHLFGARHQRMEDCGDNFDNGGAVDAHGFLFTKGCNCLITSKKHYRTMMTAGCADHTRIQYYSNPDVEYKKKNTGTTATNNNARVLRAAVCTIAGYVPSEQDAVVDFVGPSSICDGDIATFKGTVSGVPGPYFYKWRYKFGTGAWSGIISTENMTLTVPPNFQGYLYVELTAGNANAESVTTKAYKIAWCFTGTPVSRSNQAGSYVASVFPNPAADHLQVRLTEPVAMATSVRVFNTLGELCLSSVLALGEQPITQFQMGLSNLPNGQYVLSLQSAGRSESVRFSILK